MPFTPVVRDSMLNAIVGIPAVVVATHASLHSAIPDVLCSNELAGGSPVYARRQISFNPATGGRLIKNPSPAVVFNVPAGATCMFMGLWTSLTGGAFLGYGPISGDAPSVGVLTASTDKVYAPGHGLHANDRVLIQPFTGLPTPPGCPTGVYYADPINSDEYRLKAVLGGSTVNATASGPVVFQRIRVDAFSSQGQLSVATFTIGLDG